MRIVGRRRPPAIVADADADALRAAARFNDALGRMPLGERGFIPKGVYRFRTLEDADQHREACQAAAMARLARERAGG